jgi:hypothetical protein
MISLLDFVWHRYNYLWIQMASESVSMLQDAFDIQDWKEPLSFLPSVVGMELYIVSGIAGCSEFACGQIITSIEVFSQVINLFWVFKICLSTRLASLLCRKDSHQLLSILMVLSLVLELQSLWSEFGM